MTPNHMLSTSSYHLFKISSMDQVLLRFHPASIDSQEKDTSSLFFSFYFYFILKKIKNKKLKIKTDCFKIGICKQPSTKNKVSDNNTKNLLTHWKVHQIVSSSKVFGSLSVKSTWTLFVLRLMQTQFTSKR